MAEFLRLLFSKFSEGQRGFSLVETAIIVTVLGLVIAPFFKHLSQQYKKKELIVQEGVNESVTAALAVFIAENDRYPRPADWTLAPTSVNYGREEAPVAAGCVNNVCVFAGTGNNGAGDQSVYIGAVPTQALRLPPEAAVNVHGYKYFYAVTEALTRVPLAGGAPFLGEITVWVDRDDDGVTGVDPTDGVTFLDPIDDLPLLDRAQFVLVDPGQDGKGSAGITGTPSIHMCNNLLAGDYTNCEFTNAGLGLNPTVFIDKKMGQASDVQTANHFDDALIYNLVRKETTFWEVDGAVNADGTVDIGTRNDGNIGINKNPGTSLQPRERMHIVGGDIRINGTNGSVSITSDNVESDGSAVDSETGSVDGGQMLGTGQGFYYN